MFLAPLSVVIIGSGKLTFHPPGGGPPRFKDVGIGGGVGMVELEGSGSMASVALSYIGFIVPLGFVNFA